MQKLKRILWQFSLIFFLLMISPFIFFAGIRWIFTHKFELPTIPQNKYTNWIHRWQEKISENIINQ